MTRFGTLILLILAALAGCEPFATFDEPQPAGARDLVDFPAKYRGLYIRQGANHDQITWVYITRQRILEHEYFYPFEKDTASHYQPEKRISTLFALENDHCLRNGFDLLFLNYPKKSSKWVVQVLDLKKDTLLLRQVISQKEVHDLKSLAIQPDTMRNHFHLDKAGLEAFISRGGFSPSVRYYRWRGVVE